MNSRDESWDDYARAEVERQAAKPDDATAVERQRFAGQEKREEADVGGAGELALKN
jgi:hypothetical protein